MPTQNPYRQNHIEDGAEMIINIHASEGEMDCGDSDEDNLQSGDRWEVEDMPGIHLNLRFRASRH